MRLRTSEANGIAKVMTKYQPGLNYILIKKRGWVIIEIESTSFSFHRITTQKLINGIFKREDQYFVKTGKSKKPVESFRIVLERLEHWLKDQ